MSAPPARATLFPAGTLAPATAKTLWTEFYDYVLALLGASGTPADARTALETPSRKEVQSQTYTAYTTGGSSTAYTLTTSPVLAALTTGEEYDVTFNAAAGATPTLARDGLAAKALKYRGSTGAKAAVTATQIPIGWRSKVVYDGADYIVREVPPATATVAQIQPISASVGSSALTISASALALDFRSATPGSGTVTAVSGTPSSLVVSSGSTLGAASGVAARLWIAAMNNAGTIELAVMNTQLGGGQIAPVSESVLISTTAEGGAGGADSAGVWYSTTARAGLPFRLLGYIEATEAAAGTWATNPAVIQGMGPCIKKPGEVVQVVQNTTGAVATGTSAIPYDDTILQITEGDQYMSQAITPTSAINLLRVAHKGFYASVYDSTTAVALFRTGTNDALASAFSETANSTSGNVGGSFSVEATVPAGVTTSLTFTVRAGNEGGGATYTTFNGVDGARKFGGNLSSHLSVTEVQA